MEAKELARELGIPAEIIESIRRKEYGNVVRYFQDLRNEDGYAALKQYEPAVNRIVQVFVLGKNYPDNWTVSIETRKEIAKYVKRLGAAILINDIRKALSDYPQIRSLNYFLKSIDGKASRWAMLYIEERDKAYQKRKEFEMTADAEIQQMAESAMKKSVPAWVNEAVERLKELRKINILDQSETVELLEIAGRLKNVGQTDMLNEVLNEN